MAEKTGTGMGDALDDARDLRGAGVVARDLRGPAAGRAVVHSQLKIIAAAAADNPRTETELLQSRGRSTASRASRNAPPRSGPRRARPSRRRPATAAIHNARYVRHWADPDGAFRLDAKLTPDAGAKLLSVLEAEADARFDAARQADARDEPAPPTAPTPWWPWSPASPPARSEDTAATGSSRASGPRGTVVIRVDARALRRGYATAGETCTSPGWARSPWRPCAASSPMPS